MTALVAAILFLAAQKKPPPPPPTSAGPLEADRLLAEGWEKYQRGDYLGAIGDFDKVLRIDAKLARGYSNRGLCQVALRQYDKALTDFGKALDLDPRHTYAHVGKGDIHLARHECSEAIQSYTKAIDTNPNHPSAHALRGIAWIESGDYAQARVDLERAIRLLADAKESTGLLYRGAAKFWTHDFDGAQADLTNAINLAPKLQAAHGYRGRTRLALGKLREAESDLKKALDLDPRDGTLHLSMGDAFYLEGMWADAVKSYRRAGETDPSLEDAAQLRVWRAQARAGEKDQAKTDLEAYLKKRKPHPDDREFPEVAEFFLGTRAEEIVLAGLDAAEGNRRILERRCVRYVDAAIKRLSAGDRETALKYFRKAAETDVKDQIWWVIATAEVAAAPKK